MEDYFPDQIRSLWISGNFFWVDQRLGNIPGYINKILVEKLDVFVIVYLDNIFIYTKNKGENHVQAVRWVLD